MTFGRFFEGAMRIILMLIIALLIFALAAVHGQGNNFPPRPIMVKESGCTVEFNEKPGTVTGWTATARADYFDKEWKEWKSLLAFYSLEPGYSVDDSYKAKFKAIEACQKWQRDFHKVQWEAAKENEKGQKQLASKEKK